MDFWFLQNSFFCGFEPPSFDKDNASLPDQQHYNRTIFKKRFMNW